MSSGSQGPFLTCSAHILHVAQCILAHAFRQADEPSFSCQKY